MVYQEDNNTIVLVLELGEDIVEAVTDIARDKNGKFGTVSGIGACSEVELNFYNLETKTYEKKLIQEPLELTSLLGNISHIDDQPFAHLHATFGTNKYETYSGHLSKATVSATAEIVITMTNLDINRKFNDEIGLNLLNL
ncbi:DNA-binding protein [Staphylococcus gallinarum]|uniref:PPC domain-containing DNA-binding protein n=1 Tax=Staphylococcus gallinarum TaxID=1293 RepID=UPI001E287CE9|nr:PPC domain-containing DNA-binding protein [Staphylococcus gallinarum]MCD8829575.1 DNA-binding protein [Staphylococcus gallinarum]MDN6414712.1 DNA-binding protein [Staphylococcus gallinarum]MEB6054312.1 DNA-binding protein [Staphylococcus gallinarum]